MGIERTAVPDIARAVAIVATGGNPLAGAVAANVLGAILQDHANQLEELERIKADTQALVHGPYNTGMSWLDEAAQDSTSAQDRREFIEKARDKFMEAQGQENDLFRRALAEHQLGNCWALLGKNESARNWYQRAHAAAVEHLYQKKGSIYTTHDKYFSRANIAGGGPLLGGLVGGLVKVGTATVAQRSYKKFQSKFTAEALPELALISTLEQLRTEAPALALEFEAPSPTTSTLEKWFSEPAAAK